MESCKSKMKGCLALLAVLVYQLLCFQAFLTFAIGFSVVASNIYEYIMNSALPSSCETFVSMYLLTVFAEFHIFCQQECVGAALSQYYRSYPTLLTMGTMLVYMIIYVVCFGQLYIQFEEVHSQASIEQDSKNVSRTDIPFDITLEGEDGRPAEMLTATMNEVVGGTTKFEQNHTAIFLLVLSYLVYCTMKLIQFDTINQMRRIANQASCIHCVVTLGFLGVHSIMNILYSIPLLIVGFSLHMYETTGSMTFIQMNVVGVLSGMVFAVMETRRPWPLVRSSGPFYLYENNARAKAVLGQLQIFLILIFYYRPNTTGKIPQPFTAKDKSVVYFCFIVAFTMLHYVKVLVFIIVQKEEHLVPEIDVLVEGNDDEDVGPVVIVEVDNPSLEHNLDDPKNLGEDGQNVICKRCKNQYNSQHEQLQVDANMNKVMDGSTTAPNCGSDGDDDATKPDKDKGHEELELFPAKNLENSDNISLKIDNDNDHVTEVFNNVGTGLTYQTIVHKGRFTLCVTQHSQNDESEHCPEKLELKNGKPSNGDKGVTIFDLGHISEDSQESPKSAIPTHYPPSTSENNNRIEDEMDQSYHK